ncbi:MAG: DUF6456 domain-containing protein [Pseudomonadota bacterium]
MGGDLEQDMAGEPQNDPGQPHTVPACLVSYLAHVTWGVSIRALARARGCHASTVLRHVRRVEGWRDDPLVDDALSRFDQTPPADLLAESSLKEIDCMVSNALSKSRPSETEVGREARRILRRLCESGAFLAASPSLKRAVVFRESIDGAMTQTASVERRVAEQFALNEWISMEGEGKVTRYAITSIGRMALKRMLADDAMRKASRPKATNTSFAAQHTVEGERQVADADGSPTVIRCNLSESPLSLLARRRGPDGAPFLAPEEVEAGERLREDFEKAQLGPRVAQNWDRFLTSSARVSGAAGSNVPLGPQSARDRVHKSLEALGPGLSDIALRVCCFLEGLESAERRLGWSARSGKVVLKIALQRLATHYGISSHRQERQAS